jgi:Ca-activated chloride channel family protein
MLSESLWNSVGIISGEQMKIEGTAGLSLRVAASRAYVPNQGDGLLVYVTVEIETPAPLARAPLNLAVVIDRSGSMFVDDRLANALRACKHLLAELAPEDHCAIVAFADRAQVLARGGLADHREELLKSLDDIVHLDIGGGCESDLGLAAGCAEVSAQHSPATIDNVILITDGAVGLDGGAALFEIAEKQSQCGVSISTIGVGDDFDENLLTAIAEKSGGNYYYIGNPNDIPEIFVSELEWLRSISVKAALLKIKLLDGVKLVEAFRLSPDLFLLQTLADGICGDGYHIGLGDLSARVALLFGLIVPPRMERSAQLAAFALEGVFGECRGLLNQTELEIGYSNELPLIGRINSGVMTLVDRVCLVKLKEQAEIMLATGNSKRAILLLNSARTAAERLGQNKLGQIFEQLLEQIGTQGRLENSTAKRAGALVRSAGRFQFQLPRIS